MENHPIPQDITGFQFKLIGEMTIKQFAYLATGVVLAWLFLSSPLPFLIKFPFMVLCGSMGVGFAFFPVAGRPMDVMVINFIKALFIPNQYVFQKVGGDIAIFNLVPHAPIVTQSTQITSIDDILSKTKVQKPKNKLDEKELVFFQNLASLSSAALTSPGLSGPSVQPSTAPITPTPPPPPPQEPSPEPSLTPQPSPAQGAQEPNSPEAQEQKLTEQATAVSEELQKAQQAEQTAPQETPSSHQRSEELERQLQEIMAQKAQLEKQLVTMSQQLSRGPQQPVFIPSNTPAVVQETVNVRKINPTQGAKVGLPIAPDAPNLIVGIIKDPRGNILPNILVEVRDQEGNPVRAFKTNQLGQFAAATPLLNGTYTLAFEDPAGNQKFDAVQIDATGEIIPPLEVISTDAREELRKQLFG